MRTGDAACSQITLTTCLVMDAQYEVMYYTDAHNGVTFWRIVEFCVLLALLAGVTLNEGVVVYQAHPPLQVEH